MQNRLQLAKQCKLTKRVFLLEEDRSFSRGIHRARLNNSQGGPLCRFPWLRILSWFHQCFFRRLRWVLTRNWWLQKLLEFWVSGMFRFALGWLTKEESLDGTSSKQLAPIPRAWVLNKQFLHIWLLGLDRPLLKLQSSWFHLSSDWKLLCRILLRNQGRSIQQLLPSSPNVW